MRDVGLLKLAISKRKKIMVFSCLLFKYIMKTKSFLPTCLTHIRNLLHRSWKSYHVKVSLSLNGSGIQRSMTTPKNENYRGHSSCTILNSCSFQKYMLLMPIHYRLLLLPGKNHLLFAKSSKSKHKVEVIHFYFFFRMLPYKK